MDRFSTGFEVKFADDAPDGAFSGYGAFFGNVDSYGDVIQKGAFRETLKEAKANGFFPPMLLNHGGGMFCGSPEDELPVGAWVDMHEDENGLRVEGHIAIKTRRGGEVYELLRMEPKPALNGLSIGYRVREAALGTKPGEPRRTIKKAELIEVSIVTLPANGKARVGSVKSHEHIRTIRDFETHLRDVLGYSNAAAKAIASHGYKFAQPRDEGDEHGRIAAAILRGTAILQSNKG